MQSDSVRTFLAQILLERVIREAQDAEPLFEEQVWIVQAADQPIARTIANEVVAGEVTQYKNMDDEVVEWRVVNITITESEQRVIGDGTVHEVFSKFLGDPSEAVQIERSLG